MITRPRSSLKTPTRPGDTAALGLIASSLLGRSQQSAMVSKFLHLDASQQDKNAPEIENNSWENFWGKCDHIGVIGDGSIVL